MTGFFLVVFHLDERHCLFSDGLVICHDCGYEVADVVQRFAERFGIVFMRHHEANAGMRFGLGGVDGDDVSRRSGLRRMRVWSMPGRMKSA